VKVYEVECKASQISKHIAALTVTVSPLHCDNSDNMVGHTPSDYNDSQTACGRISYSEWAEPIGPQYDVVRKQVTMNRECPGLVGRRCYKNGFVPTAAPLADCGAAYNERHTEPW